MTEKAIQEGIQDVIQAMDEFANVDVVINDYIFKVPIDLSNKSENQITFIKGVLMRNLFIPYKDIMLEMMNVIRKEDSYQISKTGHMLLSTDRNSYNKYK